MTRMSTRAVVGLGAAAALVLGGVSTAVLAATGAVSGGPAGPGGVAVRPADACAVPSLPGRVVTATLSDMGGHGMRGGGSMMGGRWTGAGWHGGMMRVTLQPRAVPTGAVSLLVRNAGVMEHELVVLPLGAHAAVGQRPVGGDGRVSEAGSLGEASATCGAGEGDGLTPGSVGWTTLDLRPGRYELVCNLPGHYAAGMYAELDVTAAAR